MTSVTRPRPAQHALLQPAPAAGRRPARRSACRAGRSPTLMNVPVIATPARMVPCPVDVLARRPRLDRRPARGRGRARRRPCGAPARRSRSSRAAPAARRAHVDAHRPASGPAPPARPRRGRSPSTSRARSSTRRRPPRCCGRGPARSASTPRPPPTGPGATGCGSGRSSAAGCARPRCSIPQDATARWQEARRPATPSVVVPIPVEPSGQPAERDIAAITYAANRARRASTGPRAGAGASARRERRGARSCASTAAAPDEFRSLLRRTPRLRDRAAPARTTASRSSRRSPTAARRHHAAPGPYAALPLLRDARPAGWSSAATSSARSSDLAGRPAARDSGRPLDAGRRLRRSARSTRPRGRARCRRPTVAGELLRGPSSVRSALAQRREVLPAARVGDMRRGEPGPARGRDAPAHVRRSVSVPWASELIEDQHAGLRAARACDVSRRSRRSGLALISSIVPVRAAVSITASRSNV